MGRGVAGGKIRHRTEFLGISIRGSGEAGEESSLVEACLPTPFLLMQVFCLGMSCTVNVCRGL